MDRNIEALLSEKWNTGDDISNSKNKKNFIARLTAPDSNNWIDLLRLLLEKFRYTDSYWNSAAALCEDLMKSDDPGEDYEARLDDEETSFFRWEKDSKKNFIKLAFEVATVVRNSESNSLAKIRFTDEIEPQIKTLASNSFSYGMARDLAIYYLKLPDQKINEDALSLTCSIPLIEEIVYGS